MLFKGSLIFVIMVCLSGKCLCQLTYKTLYVQYDSAWTYKNLSLIPIRFKDTISNAGSNISGLRAISLKEAVANNKVKIKEVIYEGNADLNWLEIINTSRQELVINSGDLLAGGKQDRMIGETKIIEPGTSQYIKVYCVEKGRWDDKIKPFRLNGSADMNIKRVMDVTGRQMDVWKEIESQFGKKNIQSDTWPYLQLYAKDSNTDSGYTTFFVNKLRQSDSAYAGYVAIMGNNIISCEIFAATYLTNLAFDGMLSSLIKTVSTGANPNLPVRDIKIFMDKVLTDETMQKSFVMAHGKMHFHNRKLIHLIAYGW